MTEQPAPATRRFTEAELDQIAPADDFRVAVYHDDGSTGTPTWIWSVVVTGDLYIRSYSGARGRWYGAARKNPRGPISVAGTTYEVIFEPVTDEALLDAISAEYTRKYASGPHGMYVRHINEAGSRNATMRLVPLARS